MSKAYCMIWLVYHINNIFSAQNLVLHCQGNSWYVLDLEENRIFWTVDDAYKPIQSCFLNGTTLHEIGANLNGGYGIDVSSTHLYYAEWSNGLSKVEKSNTTSNVLLFSSNRVAAVKIIPLEGRRYFFAFLILHLQVGNISFRKPKSQVGFDKTFVIH